MCSGFADEVSLADESVDVPVGGRDSEADHGGHVTLRRVPTCCQGFEDSVSGDRPPGGFVQCVYRIITSERSHEEALYYRTPGRRSGASSQTCHIPNATGTH
jgi:hypothetical protein